MKRLSLVLIALVTSACASAPAPVTAQSPAPGDGPPVVTVSAQGGVERAPDVAVIQLAVETLAPTAAAASDRNAATMGAVLDAVRARGIPAAGIRTQRLDLQPRYRNVRDAEPEIVAYQAVNQVTVRVEDVTAVGGVVDAAVRAGANRVTGIRFELSDPESAYHEALRQAVARARAEAEVAAAALGLELGAVVQVSTGGFSPPVRAARYEVMAMERAQAPVEPGEVEVRASVTVVWRLET